MLVCNIAYVYIFPVAAQKSVDVILWCFEIIWGCVSVHVEFLTSEIRTLAFVKHRLITKLDWCKRNDNRRTL